MQLDFLIQFLESYGIPASEFADLIQTIFANYSLVLTAILLFFSLLGCFLGYRLSRAVMTLSGFLIGAILGFLIAMNCFDATTGMILLATIIAGILVAIFSYKIYQIGIFILCFILGFLLGANLIPLTGDLQFFVCTVCGFVLATLALKSVRPAIIISTSVVCAHFAAKHFTILAPLTGVAIFNHAYTNFVVFFVLCLLGIFVQFFTTTEKKKK